MQPICRGGADLRGSVQAFDEVGGEAPSSCGKDDGTTSQPESPAANRLWGRHFETFEEPPSPPAIYPARGGSILDAINLGMNRAFAQLDLDLRPDVPRIVGYRNIVVGLNNAGRSSSRICG